jgi:hypothetical protein
MSDTVQRAESKRVTVRADVVERPQKFRMSGEHMSVASKDWVEVRLKPDATIARHVQLKPDTADGHVGVLV